MEFPDNIRKDIDNYRKELELGNIIAARSALYRLVGKCYSLSVEQREGIKTEVHNETTDILDKFYHGEAFKKNLLSQTYTLMEHIPE